MNSSYSPRAKGRCKPEGELRQAARFRALKQPGRESAVANEGK